MSKSLKNTSGKKWLLSFMTICSLALSATEVQAQNCLTNNLIINTGYTPTGLIPPGTNDPHWNIISVSPVLSGTITVPTGVYPAVRPTAIGFGWTTSNPSCSWLSLYDPPAAMWYETNTMGADYSFIAERKFTLCREDEVRINMDMAFDNWIRTVTVDGVPVYTGVSSSASSNFSGFNPITSYTIFLLPGVHSIQIDVVNFVIPFMPNPHGIQVAGNIASTTGTLSIVDDQRFPGCVCFGGRSSKLASPDHDVLEQNIPNPSGTETTIGYYIREIRDNASLVIYNMTGRKVMSIPVTQSGSGKVTVPCSELAPGNYLYTLLADGHNLGTKQMVISK